MELTQLGILEANKSNLPKPGPHEKELIDTTRFIQSFEILWDGDTNFNRYSSSETSWKIKFKVPQSWENCHFGSSHLAAISHFHEKDRLPCRIFVKSAFTYILYCMQWIINKPQPSNSSVHWWRTRSVHEVSGAERWRTNEGRDYEAERTSWWWLIIWSSSSQAYPSKSFSELIEKFIKNI